MKKKMAILVKDSLYGKRMLHYFHAREKMPFSVVLFTDIEEMKQCAKEQIFALLLAEYEYGKEELKDCAELIVMLSDSQMMNAGSYPMVYRYQSADNIIKEVMQCYEMTVPNSAASLERIGDSMKLVGVYSPLHRCLKTSFALTYGQLLARKERVLYLSLDAFSGFEYLMNQKFGADLSDAVFYQQQGSLENKLTSIVCTVGQMDYIPPVRCSEDLWSMDRNIFLECLHTLMDAGCYDTIVFDMGEGFGRPELLLPLCHLIYMPIKEDPVSMCRMEEFEETMRSKGYEVVLEKIQKIILPYYHCFDQKQLYVEQLLWGELGDYVRNLLKQ
ncbi:MAG: hypothetical protein ACI4C1_03115 [Lachnospiraceae bacterium]